MSLDAAVDVARRPGRPRSEDLDHAIEAAALELLVEQGYGGMSVEGIAALAGVGKATIYRRWESKLELILDAVVHRGREHVVSPDTGSLRSDLLEIFEAVLAKFRRDGDVMRAFVAEQSRHPELGRAWRATFLDERRAVMRQVLARALERGELPVDSDLELLVDVGAALFWHRFTVTGAALDDDLPRRIVDQFFTA
ncbi:MAG: TetR/AcrR family transcriptional regulator [Acidimicrobiales bacterium]